MWDKGEQFGTITGVIAGIISGALIGNYIIFPLLLGDTLLSVLRALK